MHVCSGEVLLSWGNDVGVWPCYWGRSQRFEYDSKSKFLKVFSNNRFIYRLLGRQRHTLAALPPNDVCKNQRDEARKWDLVQIERDQKIGFSKPKEVARRLSLDLEHFYFSAYEDGGDFAQLATHTASSCL